MSAAKAGATNANAASAMPERSSLFFMDELHLVFEKILRCIFLERSRTRAVANRQHRRKNDEPLPRKDFDRHSPQCCHASPAKHGANVTSDLVCKRTRFRSHESKVIVETAADHIGAEADIRRSEQRLIGLFAEIRVEIFKPRRHVRR